MWTFLLKKKMREGCFLVVFIIYSEILDINARETGLLVRMTDNFAGIIFR